MPLSWNEIRHNAFRFTNEWTGETREQAEAKSFWADFFEIFDIRRRTVASFEEQVKKISGDYGYIELVWPGVMLVEHKSFGKTSAKPTNTLRSWACLCFGGKPTSVLLWLISHNHL